MYSQDNYDMTTRATMTRGTDRMGQVEQDRASERDMQNRTGIRTGHAEQDRASEQDRQNRTGHQNGTGRTEQPERKTQTKTGWTGKEEQDTTCRIGDY
jgi:hypothetical protein